MFYNLSVLIYSLKYQLTDYFVGKRANFHEFYYYWIKNHKN
jgi:hypothetical protein